MGRHTEYEEKFLHTALDYVKNCEKQGDVVPTVEGLADILQHGTKTLYTWAKQNEDFQHALDLLKSKQGRLLQNKGLKRETDAGITKLMLSANHGMAERTEEKHENSGEVHHTITLVRSSPPSTNEQRFSP